MEKTLKKKKTKVQRRLEVVKDAIKQLKAKKITANTGDVVNFNYDSPLGLLSQSEDNDKEIQKYLQKLLKISKKPVCKVCARGALLISTINKENNFTVGDLCNISSGSFSKNSVEDKRLLKLFSDKQLALIEEAFERNSHYDLDEFGINMLNYSILSEEEGLLAHKFSDKFPDAKKRLIAIFENIVKNKGLFRP
jgi:hypothetical protein